ncbi:MAG TPA: transglutaminase family protein [Beijerinckiaceae bacterium]|nr:transglutaminase family protein [Beijerinckiaceae bacterium]
MRLTVRHDTLYRYARPAVSAIQHLRMTPRGHDGQFIRKWRVEIDADCRLDREEDAYGNIVHTFTADGPISELRVSVAGDVETIDTHGVVAGTIERFPLVFWQRATALTEACRNIAEFARDTSSGEGGDALATLHALNAGLVRLMRFAVGDTDTRTTASDAFAARAGVCQDFAHVFIAAARSLAIPARYVGGYYLRTDMNEQEAGHAWAEAHVAGIGWIGFDPAHGMSTTDRYVRVAAGLDYLDAAPIRGTRIGGSGETMAVTVHVEQGPVIVEE